MLESPRGSDREIPSTLWGFGGLHGGLALALLTHDMTDPESGQQLRAATGRFHRPVREKVGSVTRTDATTRSTTSRSAYLFAPDAPDSPLVSATALFGAPVRSTHLHGSGPVPTTHRAHAEMPSVPSWTDASLFTPPPSLVPVSAHYELRVTGSNRPFAGGTEPRLTAWARLTDDERTPDPLRLLFLADALAPSYAAVLSAPHAIPTVELNAAITGAAAVSPWVLVDAVTESASPGGWVTETISVWGEDRALLATVTQLRVIRPA